MTECANIEIQVPWVHGLIVHTNTYSSFYILNILLGQQGIYFFSVHDMVHDLQIMARSTNEPAQWRQLCKHDELICGCLSANSAKHLHLSTKWGEKHCVWPLNDPDVTKRHWVTQMGMY